MERQYKYHKKPPFYGVVMFLLFLFNLFKVLWPYATNWTFIRRMVSFVDIITRYASPFFHVNTPFVILIKASLYHKKCKLQAFSA